MDNYFLEIAIEKLSDILFNNQYQALMNPFNIDF